jgi:hypothetical protein
MSVMLGSFFYAMPLTQVRLCRVLLLLLLMTTCNFRTSDFLQIGARDRVTALGFLLMSLSFIAFDQVRRCT